MNDLKFLLNDLPDADSAERLFGQFAEKYPSQTNKLLKKQGLLSDILTIFSYSPLLSATILQNPQYISWLERHRAESGIRDKSELLESLGRFSLTNSEIEPQILLARFRRRELLRIFLHDIRRLATIAEITEEISNLADAVLEYALGIARQELDNRYGIPLETDAKNRAKPANFCIVSLGKLGSKELNYSSDIDLLFIYSAEGETSGKGAKGAITNREYFVKLAEYIVKLVGQPTGEGAAYRVDLRLRPHGRVGALAVSAADTVRYYRTEARAWERQVLIRSRSSAGDRKIFKKFFSQIENVVFAPDQNVEDALENVRLSKEKINLEHQNSKGFNVKLGAGGIREIEFIAQALQIAHGGRDEWLRAPHTLISLTRLADRRHLKAKELTELFEAYEFLRRAEHLLQMENGLQTHLVPEDAGKRMLFARKMRCENEVEFDSKLRKHTTQVNRIFRRVFAQTKPPTDVSDKIDGATKQFSADLNAAAQLKLSAEISTDSGDTSIISSDYSQILAANEDLNLSLPETAEELLNQNFADFLIAQIEREDNFAARLSVLRQSWSRIVAEIILLDANGRLSLKDVKNIQTKLAEASIETAIYITRREMENRLSIEMKNFPLAVLGLGKLGGGGLDYQSDLDLILVFDDELPLNPENFSHAEFYARAVEIFVNTLSGFTRHGNLYRVDLRLRPDGKNGTTSIGKTAYINYLQQRAAIWEWLAYVKIRAVGGDFGLANFIEEETRKIIYGKTLEMQNSAENNLLAEETRRIRERLETEKSETRRTGREIDIKFGAGGLLDVYFAVRYLQLRDNLADSGANRSTIFTLEKLLANQSLSAEHFEIFRDGYEFLSALDHQLRLVIGRSTVLPLTKPSALAEICRRLNFASTGELLEQLTFQRLDIRTAFEAIVRV